MHVRDLLTLYLGAIYTHLRFVLVGEDGSVLRQSPSMSTSVAATYGDLVMNFYKSGLHVVRDLNPRDNLEFLRLQGDTTEILIAPGKTKTGKTFAAVVIQEWKPPSDADLK